MALKPLVVFAHGAGAGPDSEFMATMSGELEALDLEIRRFEFPYWTKIRQSGRKRPPDAQPVLQESMIAAAQGSDERPLWLMGKSMGARVAFQCADRLRTKGAIALGFPFHPPAKPERSRVMELVNHRAHNLIIQGTRDLFGKKDWVIEQSIPDNAHIKWIEQGDHDLIPLRSSGINKIESWRQVAHFVNQFIREHP